MRTTSVILLALLILPFNTPCKPLTNPAGICEQIISSKPARWAIKLGPWILCAVLFYKVRNLQKKMAVQEEQAKSVHLGPSDRQSHNTYNLSPSLSNQLNRGSLSSLELSGNTDLFDAIPDDATIDLASMGGTDKFNIAVGEHFKINFSDPELNNLKTDLSISNIAEQIAKKIEGGDAAKIKKRVWSVFSEHIKSPDLASN